MSDPYIGEIRIFAGTYAPMDWAACDGQLLPIAQNSTLYALIGVRFGGDGITNFKLPDLRGRVPVHNRQAFAASGGTERETLTPAQADHTHAMLASTDAQGQTQANGRVLGKVPGAVKLYAAAASPVPLVSATVTTVPGSGQPHDNMMPSLCLNFIIALAGTFPVQS